MSYNIGTNTGDMAQATQNFDAKVVDFDTATTNIKAAVEHLAAVWKGSGATSFVAAMQKWEADMNVIKSDLTALSNATKQSSQAISDLDQNIAKAFNGFGG